ncbi:regulatory protein TetR [Halogeometricum pallidum JCM 14848]|uniref:Regulatory protein TetR n=1 Tax=Halogeometricum pallidum JCM 14848 TaxID=1227487 RepID=M0D0Z0_HALPD|nr:TetR/AcrR family transcriptional regulator [Halogeometricum pallidum]ELZ28508.1 regulatory protein TetR [Halogeometricum pallidum JCM 14848]
MDSSVGTGSSAETREAIMEATFRALSKHGYNDLRMRDIGEEFEMSRTLIHYHYDGKHDLISAFLEYVIEQYEGSVSVDEDADPLTELNARIDQCLFGPEFDSDFGHWERMKVYHELFSQAQHNERHREVFNDHYAAIRDSITRVIERGIEENAFRPVDAEETAQFITDSIHAARARRISLGHEDAPKQARRSVHQFVLASLLEPEFVVSSRRKTGESNE